MMDDELAALEHENWIAYLTGVVRCSGQAGVTRAGGVVAILTGLPFDWFNQILMGRPIYERLGFRTVVRYAAYAEPTLPA